MEGIIAHSKKDKGSIKKIINKIPIKSFNEGKTLLSLVYHFIEPSEMKQIVNKDPGSFWEGIRLINDIEGLKRLLPGGVYGELSTKYEDAILNIKMKYPNNGKMGGTTNNNAKLECLKKQLSKP